MLLEIDIKNFAIIESITIQFGNGLNIITGETGAGKSILLGALGLVLGNRADSKVLNDDTQKAVIEARFSSDDQEVKEFLLANELDEDTFISMRREILTNGKSRSFINDTPVSLVQMKNLGSMLLHLHRQFDTSEINDPNYQLQYLDILANNHSLLTEYTQQLKSYKRLQSEYQGLLSSHNTLSADINYIQFQLEELHSASLEEGEQEILEADFQLMQNAEGIKSSLLQAMTLLQDGEFTVIAALRDVINHLNKFTDIDNVIKENVDILQRNYIDIDDAVNSLSRRFDAVDFEPEKLSKTEARLNQIYKLQKKHNVRSIKELVNITQGYEKQLGAVDNFDEELKKILKQINVLEDTLKKIAEQLTQKRKSVVDDLCSSMVRQLGDLAMPNASLQISIAAVDSFTPTGSDQVTFLFSANKGAKLQSLKEVASGGELSRVALCLKTLIAGKAYLPTLIFDEIDAGVSGDVAQKMGEMLQRLATNHQLIVITHTPQVASKGNQHFYIYKENSQLKTLAKVKQLSTEERVTEIATMMSGSNPSSTAIDAARELLNGMKLL